MGEKASGDARKKGRYDKGDDFDLARVDAHQIAGDFIFPDRPNASPEIGIHQVADNPDGQHCPEENPGKRRELLHAQKPPWPAHGVDVFQDGLDDHAESKRDDGQVIASCFKGGNGHQKADQRRAHAAGQNRRGKQNTVKIEAI